MKKIFSIRWTFGTLCFLIGCFLAAYPLLAQGPHWGGHHRNWPDSLTVATVTGTVIVDTNFFHPRYYLDENGDGVADYQLAFGPWWYRPSSGAARPDHGDTVAVKGALREDFVPPLIVVFEINGLRWREAIEVGSRGWHPLYFWPDTLAVISVSGFVLVDTTYFYHHYYLDEDGDGLPEYELKFGPPWYQPPSGATRPQEGDSVWVTGGFYSGVIPTLVERGLIIVYEINGLKWRDPTGPPPWSGRWVRRNFWDTTYVHCPTDSLDWVAFPQGCMMGMGWMMAPDSIYCQFEEIYPDSLPGGPDETRFAGYYFNFYRPSGHGMMGWQGMGRGMMRFNRELSFHLHYEQGELEGRDLLEENIKLKYWDENSSKWVSVSGYSVNTEANVISFRSTQINSYYALFAKSAATSVEKSPQEDPLRSQDFTLFQNYPNPFNVGTVITYHLPVSSEVSLKIFDVTGREVITLFSGFQEAGPHILYWDGRDAEGKGVSSGVYLSVLESGGNQRAARKLILLR